MNQLQLDERNLYGIYHTWHVPFWQTDWFFYTVCMCGALIGLLFFVLLVRWFKKRKHVETPWAKAVRLCEQLKAAPCNTQIDAKNIYCALTDILKEYSAARYAYDVRGKTDAQLVSFLKNNDFDALLVDHIQTIVDGALLVKFAKQDALQENIQKHIALCEIIIKQTIPDTKNKS